MADVLAAIAPGVKRVLASHGSDPEHPHDGADAFADASPLLAGLAAASVQGGLALGGTPGARPRRVGQSSAREPRVVVRHYRDHVVAQSEPTEHIYEQGCDRDSNTVDVFIGRLRKELGADLIETVRGLGYRMRAAG